ncbi:MAG: type II toxin-antitoxin system VapB family antitoxin [Nitrospiraceae bacterium]
MRTNIVLDDELMSEAFKYTQVRTKRELVEQALREFVEQHRRLDVRELRGRVRIRRGYDYKKMRIGTG